MRIGVIVDNELFGDPRVLNETKSFVRNGFEVFVLCFNFGKYHDFEEYEGINIHRIRINKTIKNLMVILINFLPFYHHFWKKQIIKFIKINKIDALHVHDLYMSKSAHLATKKQNIPFTIDLHENYPAAILEYRYATKFPNRLIVRPKQWEKLEKSYLSFPKKIVVLSDTFKKYLLKKYDFLNEEQFVIYPNVPDLKQFSKYNIDENILEKGNNIILFYFGGIGKRRGIITCIEAMRKLSKTNRNIKLLLIGPIDKHEQQFFQKYFSHEEIKENIIYFAWKDIKHLPSYINISDICLSPIVKNAQHESGVANKIFQYMLYEKPLIVSNCKPQEEIINNENCGVSFRSEDSDDLVEKINYLIANKDLCIEMGKNGKKAVLEKYNLENFGKELARIYK